MRWDIHIYREKLVDGQQAQHFNNTYDNPQS